MNLFLSPDIDHPPGCNPAPRSDRIPVKIDTVYRISHFCLLLVLFINQLRYSFALKRRSPEILAEGCQISSVDAAICIKIAPAETGAIVAAKTIVKYIEV